MEEEDFKGKREMRMPLQMATELFGGRNFKQIDIFQISSEAKNIRNGSMNEYFTNKEDLLCSLSEEGGERF